MFTALSYSRRTLGAAAAVLTTAAMLTACSSSDDQAAPTTVVTVTADTPTTTSKAAPSMSAKPATSSAKTTAAATTATDAAPASGSCDLSEFQAINSHINHVTTCNGKFADAGRMQTDMVLYFEFVDGAWQQIPAAGENLDGMSMACYDVDALKQRGLPTSIAERMAQCDPNEYYDPAAHEASASENGSCTSSDGYDVTLSGDIDCAEAHKAFDYYANHLSEGGGNTLYLTFDDWTCNSPTVMRAQELNAGTVCWSSGGQALLHNL
ncbi:hypothetical protein H0194_04025 [Corynebacterium incognita]|uniref:Secreted protein n=1 Tax=Corynebacterium incognita TaxID=2754725 RepID=A0A7G7CRE5_9CORY|nr:hypothetical protein [Corynebacterium incognita]QNE90161.1 hypothetical protein H0194_04025 [Corynebacterium incognita]